MAKKTPPRSKNIVKGDIPQCMESFTEVAKSLIDSKKAFIPASKLCEPMKAAINILNNMNGIEKASPFMFNAMEVLENDAKRMKMPETVAYHE